MRSLYAISAFLFVSVKGSNFGDCTGFYINGSPAQQFSHYRLYDFRNITSTTQHSLSSKTEEDCSKTADGCSEISKIVTDGSWVEDWTPRTQFKEAANNVSIPVHWLEQNIAIQESNKSSDPATYLSLTTLRLPNATQLAAEIQYTEQDILYGSIRVLARIRGGAGAAAGIFTYYRDTVESDIAILTRDPKQYVHYTNHPDEYINGTAIPGASVNASMPDDHKWTDWHVYRFDWFQNSTVWYIDGVQVANNNLNVPQRASTFMMNMWSSGGTWSGAMAVGDEAHLDIQWVEMLYNTAPAWTSSGPPTGARNSTSRTLCSINDGHGLGLPLGASIKPTSVPATRSTTFSSPSPLRTMPPSTVSSSPATSSPATLKVAPLSTAPLNTATLNVAPSSTAPSSTVKSTTPSPSVVTSWGNRSINKIEWRAICFFPLLAWVYLQVPLLAF